MILLIIAAHRHQHSNTSFCIVMTESIEFLFNAASNTFRH